jgi:hypothetical protein
MKLSLIILLFPSICAATPKFREGDIVSVKKDGTNYFTDDGLFHNCDKVKLFRTISYVQHEHASFDYVIYPVSDDSANCNNGTRVPEEGLVKR